MNNELVNTQKELALDLFKELSWHMPGDFFLWLLSPPGPWPPHIYEVS
jgi:hypothetical protein